jgi:hypothetical protein
MNEYSVKKEYDENNRLIKETYSDGQCEEMSYAPDGTLVLVSTTYPNGLREVEHYCKCVG